MGNLLIGPGIEQVKDFRDKVKHFTFTFTFTRLQRTQESHEINLSFKLTNDLFSEFIPTS